MATQPKIISGENLEEIRRREIWRAGKFLVQAKPGRFRMRYIGSWFLGIAPDFVIEEKTLIRGWVEMARSPLWNSLETRRHYGDA